MAPVNNTRVHVCICICIYIYIYIYVLALNSQDCAQFLYTATLTPAQSTSPKAGENQMSLSRRVKGLGFNIHIFISSHISIRIFLGFRSLGLIGLRVKGLGVPYSGVYQQPTTARNAGTTQPPLLAKPSAQGPLPHPKRLPPPTHPTPS